MKIYINRHSGVAYAKLTDTAGLSQIAANLWATLFLDCVFIDDDGTPVELDAQAAGAFVAKQDKHFTDAALVQALSWSKFPGPSDGYRFAITPSSDALISLLANQESAPLMGQIAWTEAGIHRATQKFSFTVANAVYRANEPTLPDPGAVWPLPGDVATKDYVAEQLAGGAKPVITLPDGSRVTLVINEKNELSTQSLN